MNKIFSMRPRCGVLFLAIVIGASCAKKDAASAPSPAPGVSQNTENALFDGLYARINTGKGDIVVRLFYDKTPLTVCNFVALAEGRMNASAGKKFYDGLTFHRVINDFMIQGGDPAGNGSGGPGYQFPDEFDPSLTHDGPGILSMANAGPGTNGSQFFITHVETPWLDGKHTIFGRVVEGQNVVNTIAQGDKINSVTIIRNGAGAEAFKADQAAFDTLLATARSAAEQRGKAKRDAAIAEIGKKFPGTQKSPTGVYYIITKTGTGNKPKAGDAVALNYKGMFLTGEIFDQSEGRGPLEFPVGTGRVIPGWDEQALDMKAGEKRTVIIPPELGYGERGAGDVIPPDTFLVFDMEMVRIGK
jgi:peptidylprolyl isomerase